MLKAFYFDGQQAVGRAAQLDRLADELVVVMAEQRLKVAWSQVQWPEPNGGQVRLVDLPDGASLQCLDTSAFDQWLAQNGHKTHWVALGSTRLRWVLFSLVALVVLVAGLVLWGIPWMAVRSVPLIPTWVDSKMGDVALTALDEQWIKPSTLPVAQQEALRARFSQLVAAQKEPVMPNYTLHFRGAGMGANAFALPGGNMVVTDELVKAVNADERVLAGVLAHELGHLYYRHGMQSIVQVSALGLLAGTFLGDFSTLLAGVPVALGQAGYSREAERQADAFSAKMLRSAGITPKVMTVLFEKLGQLRAEEGKSNPKEAGKQSDGWVRPIPMAFSSHPADAERIAYFMEQAAQCKSCR
jgi:Zn-dependent protease with chaperone function